MGLLNGVIDLKSDLFRRPAANKSICKSKAVHFNINNVKSSAAVQSLSLNSSFSLCHILLMHFYWTAQKMNSPHMQKIERYC